MQKLLVIGSGYEQVAPIKLAREMGIEAITIDQNPNAPGFKYASKGAVISTTDYEGVLAFAEKEGVDGIMTVASETAIPTIARITEKLGLPGLSYDTALASTNKNYMRKKVQENGVETPNGQEIESIEEVIDFINNFDGPWVLKPSDNSAQRGITFLHHQDQIVTAFKEAMNYATDNKLIVEQFVEGPEINICALVKDGEVIFLSLADRITQPNQNFGIAIRHLYPSILNDKQIRQVKELSIKAINGIGLQNGIAYPQIIMSKDGPRFIEIASRMPGGNNREVAMYASGIDMVNAAIQQALGMDYSRESLTTSPTYPAVYVRFITHLDFIERNHTILEIKGLDTVRSMQGIKDCYFNISENQSIPKLKHSKDRFGGIISVGSTREEVMDLAEKAYNKLHIITKEIEVKNE